METFFHCIGSEEELIFSNFPSELIVLIGSEINRNKPILITFLGNNVPARFCFRKNNEGTLFICTVEAKYVNNFKKFKELINMSMISLKSMIEFKKEITTHQNNMTQELIHNLTSLNTHNIQQLYALVPEKKLTENIHQQSETIKDIIIEKPKVTAQTLLRQIKNNLAMKVEFSVFEKTLKEYPSVERTEDYIRSKVLSILQIFILEFDEKNIEVRMGSCEKRLLFDYETLSVSLYYLFDNALKYSHRRSILNISFHEEKDSFSIHLDMSSLRIEKNELELLCQKGYRSPSAQKLSKEGAGIGMYRLQKTLGLNNAKLEIIPRYHQATKNIGGFDYDANKFKIKFMNQQNWFAT